MATEVKKYAEGSIEQWRSKLYEAFSKWQDTDRNYEKLGGEWCYPLATYKDHLIVEGYRRKYKVPFSESASVFSFGEPNEVAEVYVDKSAKGGMITAQAPEFEIHAPIVKSYIGKKSADSDEDVLWIEGLATADIVDLDGEVVSKDCHIDFEKAILGGDVELDSEHSRAWNATFGKFTECTIKVERSEELGRDIQYFFVKGYANMGYSLGRDLHQALVTEKRTDIGFSIAGFVTKDSKDIVDGKIVRKYENIDLKKISVTGSPAVNITWVGQMSKAVKSFYSEAEEAFKMIKNQVQKTAGGQAPVQTEVAKNEVQPEVVSNGGNTVPEVVSPEATVEKTSYTKEEVLNIMQEVAKAVAGVFSNVGGNAEGWTAVFSPDVATGMNTLRDQPQGGGTLGAWDPTTVAGKSSQQIKTEVIVQKADGSVERRVEYVVNSEETAVPAVVGKTETPKQEAETVVKTGVEPTGEVAKTGTEAVGAEVVANGVGGDALAGVGTPQAVETLEALGKTNTVVGNYNEAIQKQYDDAKAAGNYTKMLSLLKSIPSDKR